MPTHRVNLDALIKREDFESGDADSGGSGEAFFKLEDLSPGKLFYVVLRKPDFQRETSNWSPETIAEFIRSFLDGELIPALILWHSRQTNRVFVIDGAHRLSALIAWVNDDYGDGAISREYFGYKIPSEQVRLHNRTKALVEQSIGNFRQLHHMGLEQDRSMIDSETRRRANAIATRIPPIQKVEGGADVAERSFFRINGNPATIDPVELDIIRARRKPNAIATRALMRAGTGHKYWAGFDAQTTKQIEDLAQEIYELLFGTISDISSQSPDLPRAGQPYSADAFKMILDMVNMFNNVTDAMWQDRKTKRKDSPELPDDPDGTATLTFLREVKRVANLVSGNKYAGSLGLDPAVYSYGATGKFHPAAFLASLKLAHEIDKSGRQRQFTEVRKDFEEYLVKHKSFINQLGHSKGSRTRSLDSLLTLYRTVLVKCPKVTFTIEKTSSLYAL